jgi:hypothetical protein
MSQFAVFFDGLETDLLEGLDNASRRKAATQALNKIARDSRARAARLIRDKVNLPASYVAPAQKRLYVSQFATGGHLEAKITAQGRATSLARFVQGNAKPGKLGVYVEVSPGKARLMKRAFVIKLPGTGGGTTDTTANLGLAIRLRPGETMKNKLFSRRVASGLYVLYGPSVSQIFRANDGDGVATDMAPRVAEDLTNEFLRLIGI